MIELDWSPWYGCKKCSTGCMYCRADEFVHLNNKEYRLPIQKKRKKSRFTEKYELDYKVEPGTVVNVCPYSDFFIDDADYLRQEVWDIIHERYDCLFHIITKRPERVEQCLPDNWLLGWDNIMLSVSIEDQLNANSRLEILMYLRDRGFNHLGIVIEPMIEDIDIMSFIGSGYIDHVFIGGESYYGYRGLARELNLEWVKKIHDQCEMFEVPFSFKSTGSRLRIYDGSLAQVKFFDQKGLADFYKLGINEDKSILYNWQANIKELERRKTIEEAHRMYIIYNEFMNRNDKT